MSHQYLTGGPERGPPFDNILSAATWALACGRVWIGEWPPQVSQNLGHAGSTWQVGRRGPGPRPFYAVTSLVKEQQHVTCPPDKAMAGQWRKIFVVLRKAAVAGDADCPLWLSESGT